MRRRHQEVSLPPIIPRRGAIFLRSHGAPCWPPTRRSGKDADLSDRAVATRATIGETARVELDDSLLDEWCRDELGAGVAERIFAGGHLAAVVGLRLHDGRSVVLKVRPASARLTAVLRVQRHLHDAGVPSPRPLAGPMAFQGQTVTAETFVPADLPPRANPPPDLCAELLAKVVTAAPAASTVRELDPAPPWVAWDHVGVETWPAPDDVDVDLNAVPGFDWLDEAARRVRRRLGEHTALEFVGHVDWEAHNLGWHDDRPIVIYDWDSLAIRTDATLAGAAATVFGSTEGLTIAASITETDAFLDAYEGRRGRFVPEDLEAAWAAGLWTLLYNAKKETAGGGGGYLAHLERELDQRMRRAGL